MRTARVLRVMVGVVAVLDVLLLLLTVTWGAWPLYAKIVTATGYCPVATRVHSLGLALRAAEQTAYFEKSSHVSRREGNLELWQTPKGPFWVPKGDKILPFLLAEQSIRIYGDDTRGVHPGDVVLDCGANVGDFTRTALEAGARLVVAIEPEPNNLQCLRRNLAQEIGQGRVIVYPKGVWDHDDWLSLALDVDNTGSDSVVLGLGRTRSVRVPLTTIDKLAAELKLARVDFIKMDIEGAEKRALAGADATLAAYHPRMAISAEHLPDDATAIPALVHRLVPSYHLECGYCLYKDSAVRPQVLYFY